MTSHPEASHIDTPGVQAVPLAAAVAAILAVGWSIHHVADSKTSLFGIGVLMGLTLYAAQFGFAGAYRRAIVEGDLSGIVAQAVMLVVAMALFWPMLSAGEVLGRPVGGALAPVSISVAIGAFAFGIGMAWAGGCASGTLFTAGGGSVRMLIVLFFFCVGAFVGSLHLHWWQELPSLGRVSLAEELGWPMAVNIQVIVLMGVVLAWRRLGGRFKTPLWRSPSSRSLANRGWSGLWRGPWPLLVGACALAGLNAATVAVAGHPWSVTWAFTLLGAELAQMLGWSPDSSAFWDNGFPRRALDGSVLADTVSIMNIGIVGGAVTAATLAGRFRPSLSIPFPALASAVVGGLVLGYGARLAYGCNIGAFFSGIASTSVHGWVWIASAIPGTIVGLKLRPRLFGMRG